VVLEMRRSNEFAASMVRDRKVLACGREAERMNEDKVKESWWT